jgi:hypothetical protein
MLTYYNIFNISKFQVKNNITIQKPYTISKTWIWGFYLKKTIIEVVISKFIAIGYNHIIAMTWQQTTLTKRAFSNILNK